MQSKINAETSLKNLKKNILNKNQNKGLKEDSISSTKKEQINEKLQTLKNHKEIADIPEIKNLFLPTNNTNSNNAKVSFPSGII